MDDYSEFKRGSNQVTKAAFLSAVTAALIATAGAAQAEPLPRPAAFGMCAACHKVTPGGAGLGPNLWGVGGRKAGATEGFNYSPAMKGSGMVWNKANLVKFITDPRGTVPANRMAYAGQKDAAKANEIADYLLSLK